jgi:O-antigen/teichoic acid export membrane protein
MVLALTSILVDRKLPLNHTRFHKMKMIEKVYYNILRPFFRNELRTMSTAVVSQGMLSLASLAAGFLLAKYASKNDYGLYVILVSIIGIFGAYQSALINVPMMALVHNKQGNDKNTYIASLAAGSTYVFAVVVVLFVAGNWIYDMIVDSPSLYIMEGVVLAVVVLIYLSKEFMRTLNFVNLKTTAIFQMDLVNLVAVVGGMLLLVYWNAVSTLTGIIMLGCGYLASYLYDKRQHEKSSSITVKSMKEGLIENWHYAKWMTTGVTCSLVQDRGFMYIATAILGLSTLAEISAAKLFLMPISLGCLSCGKLLVAKGSKLLSNNENHEFRSLFVVFTCVVLFACAVYSLLLMVGATRLLTVFGEKYANITDLIALWSVYFLVYTLRYHLSVALVVYKEFKKQAMFDIYAGILTILLCGVLISLLGRQGAVLGLIAGELIAMVLYWNRYMSLKMVKPMPVAVSSVETS